MGMEEDAKEKEDDRRILTLSKKRWYLSIIQICTPEGYPIPHP